MPQEAIKQSRASFKGAVPSVPSSPTRPLLTGTEWFALGGTLTSLTLLVTGCGPTGSAPTAVEITPPVDQMKITVVDLNKLSNTPYVDLGKSVQDFAKAYHDQTGKNLVYGQTVALEAPGTSFLTTPILGPDGKPSGYNIATYKDASGQIQNRALIPMSGTTKDGQGNESEYVSYFPLSAEITSKLLAGEKVSIDPSSSKDVGKALYGLTLKPGIKMVDFQKIIKGATNVKTARDILRNNLSTFFITNPNTGKAYLVEFNNDSVIDQIVALLTGAQPAFAASDPSIDLTPIPSTATAPAKTETSTPGNPEVAPQGTTIIEKDLKGTPIAYGGEHNDIPMYRFAGGKWVEIPTIEVSTNWPATPTDIEKLPIIKNSDIYTMSFTRSTLEAINRETALKDIVPISELQISEYNFDSLTALYTVVPANKDVYPPGLDSAYVHTSQGVSFARTVNEAGETKDVVIGVGFPNTDVSVSVMTTKVDEETFVNGEYRPLMEVCFGKAYWLETPEGENFIFTFWSFQPICFAKTDFH